jgi:DNA helicase-2/ATP-dependent DNA helicase PcrA
MSQKEMLGAEQAFLKAYEALNDAQKQAVDAIEGPVMVIAGPGTGKTQILALRIANILRKTDVPPSAILALTFTEAGVASMRARLVSLIGAPGYHVRIHTFHGFCNTAIKRYPERFPRIIGNEQILEIDALRIIENILNEGQFELLRPVNYPTYYVREIKSKISETKRENISPEDLAALILKAQHELESAPDLYHEKGAHKGKMKGVYVDAQKRLDKAREFVSVYSAYEEKLIESHQYDFEDTILEAVRMIEADAELALILQEEHQYVLADEHQDANGAQNKLLELLSSFHESPNLFIVGDEKQAIYRFQGASLANFLFFKERYQGAVCVELESNYRSTQTILDAAHDVIMPSAGHEDIPRPRLTAHAKHVVSPIRLTNTQNEDSELDALSSDISELLQSGVDPREVVVLARRNADVARVSRLLERAGIKVISANDEQVLSMPLVHSFVTLMRAVAFFGHDSFLYPLLYAPFIALDNLDIYRLTEKRPHGVTLTEMLSDENLLREAGIGNVASCKEVHALLSDIVTYTKDADLESSVHYALERSGILAYLLSRKDSHILLEAIRTLVRYIASIAKIHPAYGFRELCESLTTAEEYGISLLAAKDELYPGVRVMTAHKAKGLEFDHVYIPFAHDARWGASTSRSKITLPIFGAQVSESEVGDDERRLLYVAMTRARKTLRLSYAVRGEDGREQIPSRFLADITPDYIHKEVIEHTLPTASYVQPLADVDALYQIEKNYIKLRLESQGMSVSALNNYLESPWRYFFQNLLRMPSRKEPHQYFGSAMDAALKLLTVGGTEDVPLQTQVYQAFDAVLRSAQISESDMRAFSARGEAALTGYMERYGTAIAAGVEAGVRFTVPFETGLTHIPHITLTGEYDKLEHVGGNTVRVVDFKTGSPKTRNYIEGNTKDSNGNYKRQLVFYALLATLDPVRNWKVEEGVIDFVEPDGKGVYHREVFGITQSDIEELKNTLRKAIEEISSFAFFDAPCVEEEWSREGCLLVAAFKERFT